MVQQKVLIENETQKIFRSSNYNYNFDKITGMFARWGETKEADPQFCEFGPEIIDCEISTVCKGGCKFCYKNNTPNGKNMSFETFKKLLDKVLSTNRCLTQIAFGSGETAVENPDIWRIMGYCREKGIIPNITVANITDEIADKLVKYVGACAVSRYANKDKCYDSIYKLTSRGLKQANIHQMICEQTYEQAIETINDIKDDSRLKDLNAIVFLSLKKKGRAKDGEFTSLSQDKFNDLVNLCMKNGISWGMDSCSAHKTLKAIEGNSDKKEIELLIEPCESCLFSYFINVDAMGFPCSFAEGTEKWQNGIDILNSTHFVKEVWYHPRSVEFRDSLLKCGRRCILYDI